MLKINSRGDIGLKKHSMTMVKRRKMDFGDMLQKEERFDSRIEKRTQDFHFSKKKEMSQLTSQYKHAMYWLYLVLKLVVPCSFRFEFL